MRYTNILQIVRNEYKVQHIKLVFENSNGRYASIYEIYSNQLKSILGHNLNSKRTQTKLKPYINKNRYVMRLKNTKIH